MKRAILILFFPLLTLAETGSGTHYLISEPASMMDLGLLKANLGFEEWKESYRRQMRREFGDSANGALTYATYNSEEDLIVVSIGVLTTARKVSPAECEFAIEKHWSVIRARLESWFFHAENRRGFELTDQPNGLREMILDRVELRCIAGSREGRSQISDSGIVWADREPDRD